MESTKTFQVKLNMYDLSAGLAKKKSRDVVGHQIDGVWATGLCAYGKEYYYSNGICYDLEGRTPYGK